MTQPTLRNSTRTGFAVIALTAAGIGLGATGANAATPTNVWDNLAQCESSGNWNINTGNGYSGGLQFSPSTWAAFGGTGSAANASREQQIAVAERVQAGQGWGAWPSCSAKLGLSGAPAPAQAAPVQQYVAPAQAAPVKQYVAPAPAQAAPAQQYVAPAQAAPVKQYVAPAQAAPAQQYVAPVQAAPRHVAPVALSGESYTVQSGDSLSKIAQKLNIAGGWQRLADANAASVANPHLIFVGQVLNLPA